MHEPKPLSMAVNIHLSKRKCNKTLPSDQYEFKLETALRIKIKLYDGLYVHFYGKENNKFITCSPTLPVITGKISKGNHHRNQNIVISVFLNGKLEQLKVIHLIKSSFLTAKVSTQKTILCFLIPMVFSTRRIVLYFREYIYKFEEG